MSTDGRTSGAHPHPSAGAEARSRARLVRVGYTPLLRRVLVVNAAVLVGASAVTVLALAPIVSSEVALTELGILAGGLAIMFFVNLLLLRRALRPLEELRDVVRVVDPLRPGQRVRLEGPASEVIELAEAFNDMLGRLEDERRESARQALEAQEAERLRVAQELHDEIGQSLTAVLLQLGRVERSGSPAAAEGLAEARETARSSLEDVRRIARRLRPETLDDLGLGPALADFCDRLAEQSDLRIERSLAMELPPLKQEEELVVYRVAQEALTNVVRHADTDRAELRLEVKPDRLRLVVQDWGRGLDGQPRGGGVQGMRERALLVGGQISVTEPPGGGVRVTLDIPLDEAGLWYR